MILCKANLPHRLDAMNEVFLARHFGGFTLTEAIGSWGDDDGKIVTEKMNVYEIALDRARVPEFRSVFVAHALEQKQRALYLALGIEAEIMDLYDDTA